MSEIIITNAYEANLKNISLKIPKNKLTVCCGVSGSGKSTLAVDVLFHECQRQYLEAMGMEGIHKPKVDEIENASAAVLISQTTVHKNPRSTVGTLTHLYTDLRMIFEKLHQRTCPHCHQIIKANECEEKSIKEGNDFHVYMKCPFCQQWMDKLTRTHFSANTQEGCCQQCAGLGETYEIEWSHVIHEERSILEGAIDFWKYKYGEYQKECFKKTCQVYHLSDDLSIPYHQLSPAHKTLLIEGTNALQTKNMFPTLSPPKSVQEGAFEGLRAYLMRKLQEKEGLSASLQHYFNQCVCPACQGTRLNALSRSVTVHNITLPEVANMPLEEIDAWIVMLKKQCSPQEKNLVNDYLLDIQTKLSRLLQVGLGYLTLDRTCLSLSGGEAQRIKLAALLDSKLSGLLYVLDEPTIGLHGKDTQGILEMILKLKEKGNTILVIEHDPLFLQHADLIVELGPKAGLYGGNLTAVGTYNEIMQCDTCITKNYVHQTTNYSPLPFNDVIQLNNISCHNIHHASLSIPKQVLCGISGVSGSGKSTLIFDVLAHHENYDIQGIDEFDEICCIKQTPLTRMKRSNIATYSTIYEDIRKLFAATAKAKEMHLTEKHFSFNTSGGRCEMCEGLGVIESNLLFFENLQVECPQCHGQQFKEDILQVKVHGKNIAEILHTSIEEACLLFKDQPKIMRKLQIMKEVGLSYLTLHQTLPTLSGGEAQRLKLASQLMKSKGKNLYLIDEPTIGLHPLDIQHFLVLLHRLVEQGHSVIVIEHNAQLLKECDWLIDLGPQGGNKGGQIIFTGTPSQIMKQKDNATGQYLRNC